MSVSNEENETHYWSLNWILGFDELHIQLIIGETEQD